MTLTEFQAIFTGAHRALADLVREQFPAAKVLDRDAFDEDDKTWIGRLKNGDGVVDCWTISIAGVESLPDAGAIATDVYRISFKIVGYYKYDFGTNAENSTRTFTENVNKLRFALRDNRTLGEDWIADHSGFNERVILGRIDTQPVHICRADLHAYTSNIPYTYQ